MRPETVLGLATSAAHCAAALLLPDGRALNRLESMEKGQAERLMPLLEDLLAAAVNEGVRVVKETQEKEMGALTGSFNLPAGLTL